MANSKQLETLFPHPALYTDYYELTMGQGYYLSGRQHERACFDYFFRDIPFGGGYVIFAGLSDLLNILDGFKFRDDELKFLASQGFEDEFISYLRNFEFTINMQAAREGEIIFPKEPVVRVEGNIIEAQMLETLLLNILNFESLIATKASRMKLAAGEQRVLDFGLRRSQGTGGIQASKAAAIGGVEATSNVYSSFRDGIPASGTMAHSWIQSFEDEITAFRKYAEYYPDSCILLVDTYSTLQSGIPNAIKVAKELEKKGHKLKGIRLDSGDLAYFARKARNQLDRANLEYVKIAASNQLDEYLIKSLKSQGAPIDLFGVGTRLVTAHGSPALDGVYKLSAVHGEPKLKISENVEKITLPGAKKTVRYFNQDDNFYGDGILTAEEEQADTIYHPHYPYKHFSTAPLSSESLLHPMIKKGEIITESSPPQESAQYAKEQLQKLNDDHKRFDNPHIYKVGLSKKLMNLRDKMTDELN